MINTNRAGADPPVLVFDKDAHLYEKILKEKFPQLNLVATADPEQAVDYIRTAEIILAWKIPDSLLAQAGRLRWLASLGAGNEQFVNNPVISPEVILTKTTVYGEMMSEYLFAYLLYFARDIRRYLQDQENRLWAPVEPGRLRGRVIGILGLGSVGMVMARTACQFGMTVWGVNRTGRAVKHVERLFPLQGVREMIPQLDYLVNVLPFTPATKGILGKEEFALMKPGSMFVNVGRGKTIDEQALIEILSLGRIQALLDVFSLEPLPPDSPLWSMSNVTITPHVSGANIPREICAGFSENYVRWLRGQKLHGIIERKHGY